MPGHELSGLVSELGYGTTGLTVGQRVFGLADWTRDGALAEYTAVEARNLAPAPGGHRLRRGRRRAHLRADRLAGPLRPRRAKDRRAWLVIDKHLALRPPADRSHWAGPWSASDHVIDSDHAEWRGRSGRTRAEPPLCSPMAGSVLV